MSDKTKPRRDALYHEMRAKICQSLAHYMRGIPVDETTAIDYAAEVAANEVEELERHLRALRAYSVGFVFTDDPEQAKTMPVGQRYAAIAGYLSRLDREGVLRSGGVS